MKKAIFSFFVCFVLVCICTKAFAASDVLEEQIEAFDFSALEEALDALGLQDVFSLDFSDTIRATITSDADFETVVSERFLSALKETLFSLRGTFALLCAVHIACALCNTCVQNLDQGVQTAVQLLCGALCGVMLIGQLSSCVAFASLMLQELCFWLENLLPVMLVILSTLGASASVSALSPSFAAVNMLLQQGILHMVFPMLLAMGAFSVVDALDEKRRFKALISFLSQLIKWSMGLVMTLFIGMLTLKSINAVSYDALSIRTMKYALGGLPMVGGAVSDSMDTIISSLLMLKNGVGTVGVIVSVLICMGPCLKIAMQLICLQGTSALMQSLDGGAMHRMSESICSVYRTLLYVLIAAMLLFFVTVMLFIGAGNAAFTG